MECVKCGREIAEEAAFCPYCGEKVAGLVPGEETPLYLADVKGLMKSGKLVVYRDRVEFVTSSVQKTVFNYSALISVKKGLDRISFITEDGGTESLSVNRKNIHEAFLYIDKASRPYIAERKKLLQAKGIQYSFVSSIGLNGGILNILDDRAEFKARSGQSETVGFKDVRSVGITMGQLEFSLIDGKKRSYAIDKEIRDEVLSFVQNAIAPYIAERKEALLSQGIYYSCLSSYRSGGGTLDILEDRVEFKGRSGQNEMVFFRDVRTVSRSAGVLELWLTDGTSRSFSVENDIWGEVISFVENAILPYVTERTAGFETAFGIDERIEMNEERGVFHIIRQGGREITKEYPTGNVVKCERTECSTAESVLGGVLSGGRAILSGAAKAVGGASGTEELISYAGVLLTVRTDQGMRTELVRFGNFSLGMTRSNKKYSRYISEIAKFMNYLSGVCPECEFIVPALLEAESEPEEIEEEGREEEAADPAGEAVEKDPDLLGIIKYIAAVSAYIGKCTAPVMIAIQGNRGKGKNSIMKMLSDDLEEGYKENLIWFNTWQFSQSNLDEPLSMLVGKELINQLRGTENVKKGTAVKVAKGIINIAAGFISQGGTDGQNLTDALFGDDTPESLGKVANVFSNMIKQRIDGKNGKVLIFIDDLDKLVPERGVELLEVIRNFFYCEGCVFLAAVDYNFVISGAKERYGRDFDEKKGKSFFDKMFRVSFRVPESGYNMQNYVKSKLEQIEVHTDDEAELAFYVELIRNSVGCEPENTDRLFDSFLLIKNMDEEELYKSKDRRLMLFALLCMQERFHGIYDFIVRMKEKVTPDFLLGLCSEQSAVLDDAQLSDDEKEEFCDFANVFCDIINTDQEGGISEEECRVFEEVLDFSRVTSK